MTQQKNRYSAEFKRQAVELVLIGKPITEVAEELGIGTGNLYRWVAERNKGSEAAGSPKTDKMDKQLESNNIKKLQKKIAQLELENDILKKAAVILGTKTPMPVVK